MGNLRAPPPYATHPKRDYEPPWFLNKVKAFFPRGVHSVPLDSHDTNVKWDTVSGLQRNLAYHSLGFWDIPLKKTVEKALKLHAFRNPNGPEGFSQGEVVLFDLSTYYKYLAGFPSQSTFWGDFGKGRCNLPKQIHEISWDHCNVIRQSQNSTPEVPGQKLTQQIPLMITWICWRLSFIN